MKFKIEARLFIFSFVLSFFFSYYLTDQLRVCSCLPVIKSDALLLFVGKKEAQTEELREKNQEIESLRSRIDSLDREHAEKLREIESVYQLEMVKMRETFVNRDQEQAELVEQAQKGSPASAWSAETRT